MTLGSMALALSAACGGGGGGDEVNLEDFCAEDTGAFSQFVGKLVECTPEFEIFLGSLPTEASISAACNAQFAPYVDDGTIAFGEKAALDACIAAILAADCETLEVDDIAACNNISIGQLETGAVCENSDQCAGDAYCTAPAANATCGACAPLLADGASCEDGSDCLNNNCRNNGTCGGFGLAGATCEDTDDCSGRLVCSAGSVCASATAVSVGDACTEFEECGFPLSNLYCNSQMMMCEAFIPLGGDCFDGEVALGFCDLIEYESCDTDGTGTCVAPTEVGLGAQCGFVMGRKCEAGLVCDDGTDGRCVATGEGAACTFDGGDTNTCGIFLECKSDGTCGYEDEYTGMCPAAS